LPAGVFSLCFLKAPGPPLIQSGYLPVVPLVLGPEKETGLSVCLQVDTASEVEELEVDSISLLPAAPEANPGGSRIQVFLARYRWAPHLHLPPPSIGGIWEEVTG
jgi:hypothetical protein